MRSQYIPPACEDLAVALESDMFSGPSQPSSVIEPIEYEDL